MAGAQIQITSDTAASRASMTALLDKVGTLKPFFTEIGALLLASTQRRFETDETPQGEHWKALALSTQLHKVTKRRSRGAEHILINKGLLVRSLTYLADALGLAVGTSKAYAAIQQLGGTPDMAPGPAAIPARAFLGLDPHDEAEIGDLLVQHLAAAIG